LSPESKNSTSRIVNIYFPGRPYQAAEGQFGTRTRLRARGPLLPQRNIILLQNDEAAADRILDTLQTHLVDAAKPGDASFFYCAGHGSRITNTMTRNSSGTDSTLAPADALLGVPDIRSRELDRIYLQARKRNVEFTVVEDSCFSGAGIRGPLPAGRTRAAGSDDKVSFAEALEGPLPEEQGPGGQLREGVADIQEVDLRRT
jgi:hypothetical protein